jgi:hypothetical protein
VGVWGNYNVVGRGHLKHGFSEWFPLYFTILSHPSLGLEINCSEAGTLKVGAKHLVTLTEVHVVALNASGEVGEGEEFISMSIAIVLADCN